MRDGLLWLVGLAMALWLGACNEDPVRGDAAADRGADRGQPGELAVAEARARDGAGLARERGASERGAQLDNPATSTTGTIVPLYAYPTDASWALIVQAKQQNPSVPVVAIVNVTSGPGDTLDAAFTSGIQKLVAAGIVAIGYVDTSFAKRDQTIVKGEIDLWKSRYPQLTGIFFDQQTNTPGLESYYQSVSAYAKSKGLSFTVGNPGADVPQSYLGTVDTMFIYENAGLPSLTSLGGHPGVDKKSFGIIPYAVAALDTTFIAGAKKLVGYIYCTDGTGDNPWSMLPPYFGQLLAELAK